MTDIKKFVIKRNIKEERGGTMKIINIKLSATVCYLIPIADKYLLIDTGYEKDRKLFNKKLSKLGISIKDIGYVLLTHHHDDHAGLLKDIKERNPSCRIIIHANAIPLLEKGKNDINGKYINRRVAMILKVVKKLNKEWDFTFPPYRLSDNDIIINEETSLREIGINIPGRIIYTPGHTEDSITLLLDDGSCFVGDAAANMMQSMGARYCVIFITDLKKYYRSWEKLINENIRTIYPGHGKPFSIEKLKSNLYKNEVKWMVEAE